MLKKLILLTVISVLSTWIGAQTTGSFQQSITFTQADYNFTRTLYFYVPTDYDANQAYKLVVGFRGGPHSSAGQFRDQLRFLSDSLDAIILCPENEAHFWNQEGLTKQLFRYSVDTAMAMYNIDPDFIYLTGLSYGGRHAVIVSMDTDDGAIPALRGVIPFAAGSESDLQPNYDAIDDFPPACICIGLNDNSNFQNVSRNLHMDISSNGGASLHNEISGVGHTVVFPTYPEEMMECITFIESQYETITSIEEAGQIRDRQLRVFPNPAHEYLSLDYPKELKPKRIQLLDSQGRLLREIEPQEQQINLSGLGVGMVWIVVVDKEGNQYKESVIIK